MLIIIFSAICLYYILRELLCYYRKKQWGIFYTYAALLLVAYTLSVLMALGVQIPSIISSMLAS